MARQRKKKSTVPDGFPEKTWNRLSSTWRDAAQTKSTTELEQEIIKAVRSISAQSFDMKNDAKLISLREELKDLKGGYMDSIAADKAKVDFCVFLFNTRGMPVSSDTQDAMDKSDSAEDESDGD